MDHVDGVNLIQTIISCKINGLIDEKVASALVLRIFKLLIPEIMSEIK